MTIRPRLTIFPVGEILDGIYEIRGVLQTGRLGQVLEAFDRRLGRRVVIKAMWPGLSFEPLRHEARALAAFHHPGMVVVHGLGTHADVEYLILEWLDGMTLAAHFEKRASSGGFTIAETVETLVAICDALTLLHSAGMAHGNLRPETVMLGSGGRTVLFDFGVVHRELIAGPRDASDPWSHASDEQIADAQQRDLRRFGLVAFEMLAGATPRRGFPVLQQLAEACSGVPAALSGLVAELLTEVPTRPHAAHLVMTTLRSIRDAPRDRSDAVSIVVADDDADMRKLLGTLIRAVAPNAHLRFASDGAETLRLVQRQPPDLLFLDLQMPALTGLEVCMYLRGTSLGDRITICVISQFVESHRSVLKALGVSDILLKGAGPEILAAEIGRLVRRIVPGSEPEREVVRPIAETQESTTVAGRYVLDKQLGVGGMGCVYEARHVELGKRFALKVIGPAFANDAVARARFNEEAKLASEISHPNIVSVVDYGEDPKVGAFMVMELLDGETLASAGAEQMSIRRACDVLGQVADALDLIHRRGIVHGDVKAENIMLIEETVGTRRRQIARLLDFGLAHRIAAIRDDGRVSGTPEYLAPERVLRGPASVVADVYALGVLGYFVLTTSLPFQGTTEDVLVAQVERPVPPFAERRTAPIDPALEALILRAMAKDPSRRHPSAAAFRYELNTVMDMLELGRRRRPVQSETTSTTLAQVFGRSLVAQAVVSVGGAIAHSNEAFQLLLGEVPARERGAVASLEHLVPGIVDTIGRVQAEGRPVELRVNLTGDSDRGCDLVVWLSPLPLPDSDIHLLVRIGDAIRTTA